MKQLFNVLYYVVRTIAFLVFFSGVFLTVLGGYELVHTLHVFSQNGSAENLGITGIGVLKAIDLFLVAIVLFVFSLGLMMLFNNKSEKALPENLPAWLKIHSFLQLKVILWEAILTTLVISTLARLAELRWQNTPITWYSLVVPSVVLMFAVSLYFLKKGEH